MVHFVWQKDDQQDIQRILSSTQKRHCLYKELDHHVLMPVQVTQRGESPGLKDFSSNGAVSSLLEQLQGASSELSRARAILEAALQERPAAAPATDSSLTTSKHCGPQFKTGVSVQRFRSESENESACAATPRAITAVKGQLHGSKGLAVQVDQVWKTAQVL